MSLAARSFSAGQWTIASNLVRAACQLAQLAVLTRFLSPQDYGLMALVLVVVSYAALFSDMGLSAAFVHRQSITREERSSLYWLSVLIGASLMLLVMAASSLIAEFFNEPELETLLMLVATNFLVVALGQQLRTDAEKALNFLPVALIEIVSAVIALFVGVIAAWLGWGVYALVAAALVSAWSTMLLCWTFLARGWRPLWRLRWVEVRWFLHFGGGMVMNSIINQVNATVDVLLGGRLLGAGQLGIYSVPRNLILQMQSMVNPIFTRVGFPVIASIQHDMVRVRQVYLKIINLSATINAPIYVAVSVFAPELVRLLLGSGFHDSAPLLRALAIWGLLRSFGNPVGSLLFGLGRVRLALSWNLGLLCAVPLALWWGTQFGAIGMAWTMAAVMAILFIPGWVLLVRPVCGIGLWAYSSQIVRPTFCAMLAGSSAYLAVIPIESPLVRVFLGFSMGLCAYIALSWFLNRQCIETVLYVLKQRDVTFVVESNRSS